MRGCGRASDVATDIFGLGDQYERFGAGSRIGGHCSDLEQTEDLGSSYPILVPLEEAVASILRLYATLFRGELPIA